MLRKIVWFALLTLIAFVWLQFGVKYCTNDPNSRTAQKMSELDANLGSDEEVVFKADEDSGDDEYIISDESDKEDRIASADGEINYKEAPGDYVEEEEEEEEEEEDDFSEKSPVSKVKKAAKSISRKAIAETTYSNSESVGYFVITGSFSDEENADRMVEQMKEMGYEDAEKIVFDFSQYFSVVSGKYDTESSARAKSLELKNRNVNAYVHKMRSKLFGD